jgi:hypothetical protein
MNCFLVMLRHGHDDLPLFVSGDPAEARVFAAEVAEDSGEREKRILSIDCSTASCVAIYEFQNGKMVAMEVVKSFD